MREWAVRLGLAAMGVALALVVGLVGLRLTGRQEALETALTPCVPAEGDWAETVRRLVYHYRQPCHSFYWDIYPTGEFYNLITLNNYGLHDAPLTIEKPPDTTRVLIVGDSFAQGWQVTLEEGFPYLLEQQLNTASGRKVEVINLSVDTFGTDRELLLYAGLGSRFQPDVVLLAFYVGNDIKDNSPALTLHETGHYVYDPPFFTLNDSGTLQLHNTHPLPASDFAESPAWSWLNEMIAGQASPPPIEPPPAPPVTQEDPRRLAYPTELGLYLPEDALWREARALTEALVLQFAALARAEGSRFGVLLIPDRRAVHSADWDATVTLHPVARGANPLAPGDRMESFLAQHDIPTLNLTYALSGWALAHPGERAYYPGDGHFNANGHAVVAQRTRFWLQEVGFVG